MVDLFKRLDAGRPPPAENRPKPDANARDLQKLHEWIQHWDKPTVSVQDICYRGPNSVRNRKKAIGLAEILAGHGWLIPIKRRRRDMKWWRIVRGLGGYPTVATMATAVGIEARPTPLQNGQTNP
jgi:hypothetical protein